MATAGGRDATRLKRHLADEGWRFDFFQAVRVLQRSGGAAPVGTSDDPAREGIRFTSDVSMSFPATSLRSVEPDPARDDAWQIAVNFMGVASPASYGSLPLPYAEFVLDAKRDRNPALTDFLDLFNHRLISLFYRAWEKYRYAVVYERQTGDDSGLYERALMSLMGLGTPGLTGRLPIDDRALLARTHALCRHGISARALSDLVEDYFRAPTRVRQFVPHWYAIEDEDRTRLGRQSHRLGVDARLGQRVPMAQSRFRVVLGPLDWERFCDFLPTGTAFEPLAELCAVAAGPEFDFEFQLVLDAAAAPGMRLTAAADRTAPRLGWSTWLQSADRVDDLDDVIIDGEMRIAATHPATAPG